MQMTDKGRAEYGYNGFGNLRKLCCADLLRILSQFEAKKRRRSMRCPMLRKGGEAFWQRSAAKGAVKVRDRGCPFLNEWRHTAE